ncbi:MAG: orotidine-5'-phosphate decarboxylase [Blastocatellia bacterium]|nr:orotidine-5'-phosphate decarboxylase [Blastocatellia bacterium]
MTTLSAVSETLITAKDRVIIALDVSTAAEAREVVGELKGEVGAFKIGLQLFTAAGPDVVREITSAGVRVFLDLKFHDIPNTVAHAAVEAARLGVWMLNVHALGGGEMLRTTAVAVEKECREQGIVPPKLIAVTILTSSSDDTLRGVGIEANTAAEVLKLARLTAECGFDGVVASAREAEKIKGTRGLGNMLVVTPGIRPVSATNDDQYRVMTPGAAVAAGSDYLVIGRPIVKAPDRISAVRTMIDEITTFTE